MESKAIMLVGRGLEFVRWFILLIPELIIPPNEPTHRLEFAETKALTW
jgi:hypothetical protein